jgi:hypothetical protein
MRSQGLGHLNIELLLFYYRIDILSHHYESRGETRGYINAFA